jgi:hypothetical protein
MGAQLRDILGGTFGKAEPCRSSVGIAQNKIYQPIFRFAPPAANTLPSALPTQNNEFFASG